MSYQKLADAVEKLNAGVDSLSKRMDAVDTKHLNALQLRLSNERNALARAKTSKERDLRKVWIAQIEKEIAGEEKFLKKKKPEVDMTDEELLAALLK
jgi:outer membrane murein-binding lipoprotein Lpp